MKGIGIDIIEINRIAKAIEHKNFLQKCFTRGETELIAGRAQTAAGNFAAKEAVSKALGTGFKGFSPADIEILRGESGEPRVNLRGAARKAFDALGASSVFVTISHCNEYAAAAAVIE